MIRLIPRIIAVCLLIFPAAKAQEIFSDLDACNVVWTSQSRNASESMPCGGGDTGMNVWVENGDLLLYAQRSGCFDENNSFLKLGRLRVRLDPNPFADQIGFRQELKLRQGIVEISGKSGGLDASVRIWAEVHRPVVHVEIACTTPISAVVSYESWRYEDRDLPNDPGRPRFGCLGWDGFPGKITAFRDEIQHLGDQVVFFHRNRDENLLFNYTVRQQGLDAVKNQLANPQKGRTFGGVLRGDGFIANGTHNGKYVDTPFKAWNLRSRQPAARHHLELVSHIAQTSTLDLWKSGLRETLLQRVLLEDARARSLQWWAEFWNRSHIFIQPGRADAKSRPWRVARNYQLFRYQLGCNAYGEYPTKFNGGNFTFDPSLVQKQSPNTPDWRQWGGGSFTAQNQRLVHWPMLKSGDADLIRPQLEFYRRVLPSATARVKTYYGHSGALFSEQLENFGLPISAGWGWSEPGAKVRQRGKEVPFCDPRIDGTHGPNGIVERGEQANAFVSYHYESQLEMSYLALERHRFSGEELSPYLPLIRQSVRFFDEHYQLRQKNSSGKPLDDHGKLVIFPSTSCETYRGARNPTDLIAGLQACLHGLLSLDDSLVPSTEKSYYRGFIARLPDYSYGEAKGDRILKPAESHKRVQNYECPQFYPLFPFNRFSLAKDDMKVFRDSWKHGTFAKNMVISWHQDGIFFARMGMTPEAADFNARKLDDAPLRFPTFWGPGHDWTPDHNWGGTGMIGLQEMLMQTIGQTIHLFPAWPKDWDVDFKLHAPAKTVIECRYQAGKITFLKVTPESRLKDVILPTE